MAVVTLQRAGMVETGGEHSRNATLEQENRTFSASKFSRIPALTGEREPNRLI